MMKALRTGSGYYIDVGASDLIAAGEIKVRSGVEPRALKERSVILSNGSEDTDNFGVAARLGESFVRARARPIKCMLNLRADRFRQPPRSNANHNRGRRLRRFESYFPHHPLSRNPPLCRLDREHATFQ